MKLDSEKKVKLCQQALYSKQLTHYKKLCEIYKSLADIAVSKYRLKDTPSASVADQVESIYGNYLSMATQGDLSFIEHNVTSRGGFLTTKFTQEQLTLFRNFATESEKFSTFKIASKKLYSATHSNNKFDINPELLEEYHDFMQNDKETISFDKFISENPPRWIGHIYYQKTMKEFREIKKIDPNHLSALEHKTITPKSFGASITGAKGKILPAKSKISKEINSLYSKKEQEKYSKDKTFSESLGVATYKTGHKISENTKAVYKAHKGTLKKAVKRAALIGLAIGLIATAAKGIDIAKDAIEFKELDAYTNQKAGYAQTIDDETLETLQNTDVLIQNLENSSSTPTTAQLDEVRDALDEEIDLVIKDLVGNSFSEQYPNLTITDIDTHYDKSDVDPNNNISGNYIYISCQDANGKTYNYTITDFRSQGDNRTKTSFDNEYTLDYDLSEKIETANSQSYEKNTKTVKEIIEEFKKIHADTIELAGADGLVSIPQAAYDSAKAADKENFLDLLKAKYSEVSIFALKPNFKLVIPEKIKTENIATPEENIPSTTSTNTTLGRDDR